jgi:hypothetical protein
MDLGGQLWDGTSGALNNFGKTIEAQTRVTLTTPTVNYAGVTRALEPIEPSRFWCRTSTIRPIMVSIIRWRIWTRFRAICKICMG